MHPIVNGVFALLILPWLQAIQTFFEESWERKFVKMVPVLKLEVGEEATTLVHHGFAWVASQKFAIKSGHALRVAYPKEDIQNLLFSSNSANMNVLVVQ